MADEAAKKAPSKGSSKPQKLADNQVEIRPGTVVTNR